MHVSKQRSTGILPVENSVQEYKIYWFSEDCVIHALYGGFALSAPLLPNFDGEIVAYIRLPKSQDSHQSLYQNSSKPLQLGLCPLGPTT